MNSKWTTANTTQHIDDIIEQSNDKPQLIFKHSTACPTSHMAHRNVDKVTDDLIQCVDIHYVDVIEDRPVSLAIADRFGITHQSPQVILVDKGQATWDTSHTGIYGAALLKHAVVTEGA